MKNYLQCTRETDLDDGDYHHGKKMRRKKQLEKNYGPRAFIAHGDYGDASDEADDRRAK